jgi:hypothetical protein
MWQQNGVGYPSFRPENVLLDEPSDDGWRGCESGITTHVYLSRCWEQMTTVHQHHVMQPMTSYRHHSQTGFQSRHRRDSQAESALACAHSAAISEIRFCCERFGGESESERSPVILLRHGLLSDRNPKIDFCNRNRC